MLLAPGLLGCAAGPDPETLVAELRVVAMVAEPPWVAPEETTEITVHAMDPGAEGADVWVWLCTPDAQAGCREADGAPLSAWLDHGSLVEGRVVSTLQVAAAVASDADGRPPTQLWALACAPGLCPAFAATFALLEAGADAPDDFVQTLADPSAALAGLPLTGVSLARRVLPVIDAPVDERWENPVLVEAPATRQTVAPEAEVPFQLVVSGAAEGLRVVPFSTSGGFAETRTEVSGGTANLTWYAPTEGRAAILLAVEDEHGGVAVWRGAATVEEP